MGEMMKKIFWLVILGVLAQTAFAIKLKTLNSAQVPVTAQSDQQKNQAVQQAFVQVLSKMSGSVDILKNPDIKAALPNAQKWVEEYGYVPSGLAATPYFLNVQFDTQAVRKLLRQAGIPIWDANRPLILVWMTVTAKGQLAEVADNHTNNEWVQLLKQAADQRGIPILLPIMDITELNQVSVDEVRAANLGDTLRKASQRYHSDGVLIGSIEQNGPLLQGHWKLIVGDDQWDWNFNGNSAAALIDQLANKMVNTLGERYAAVQTEKASSDLILIIKGIAQHEDFEHVMHFLKHITLIKAMEIENINGDSLILHVNVQGAQTAFMQEASVGQHLKLQLENGQELTYAWQP